MIRRAVVVVLVVFVMLDARSLMLGWPFDWSIVVDVSALVGVAAWPYLRHGVKGLPSVNGAS